MQTYRARDWNIQWKPSLPSSPRASGNPFKAEAIPGQVFIYMKIRRKTFKKKVSLNNLVSEPSQTLHLGSEMLFHRLWENVLCTSSTVNRHLKTVNRHLKTINRHLKNINRHLNTINRHLKNINRHLKTVNRHKKHQQTPKYHQQTPENHQKTPENHQQTPENCQQTHKNHQQTPEKKTKNWHLKTINRHLKTIKRHLKTINTHKNHQQTHKNNQQTPENCQRTHKNHQQTPENHLSSAECQLLHWLPLQNLFSFSFFYFRYGCLFDTAVPWAWFVHGYWTLYKLTLIIIIIERWIIISGHSFIMDLLYRLTVIQLYQALTTNILGIVTMSLSVLAYTMSKQTKDTREGQRLGEGKKGIWRKHSLCGD